MQFEESSAKGYTERVERFRPLRDGLAAAVGGKWGTGGDATYSTSSLSSPWT